MSRASTVRDELTTELASQLPTQTVEAFIVPNYTREQLEAGPRIVVRNAGRMVSEDQGYQPREVIIEVGVVGISPVSVDGETMRQTQLDAFDVFDGVMEDVIDLFVPDGVLRRATFGEHTFEQIEQASAFDASLLYEKGVWLSLLQLTYRDARD